MSRSRQVPCLLLQWLSVGNDQRLVLISPKEPLALLQESVTILRYRRFCVIQGYPMPPVTSAALCG